MQQRLPDILWQLTADLIVIMVNLHKGTKLVVTGRIQTGSYTNKDGVRVYTTDVVVEDQEFAESKNASGQSEGGYNSYSAPAARPSNNSFSDGFMNIPDGIDEELPFN